MKPTTGDIAGCPCPHCGKPCDLRGFRDMAVLDQGATVTCDHCTRKSRVQGTADQIRVVWGTSAGPVQAVRCPGCKAPEDMTELYGMGVLENGNTVQCEICQQTYPIKAVKAVTLVTLVPTRS